MPFDGMPYVPKRPSKSRLEYMDKLRDIYEGIYSRPMPSPEEDAERAKQYQSAKSIGQFDAALHKIKSLLPIIDRFVSFAPEGVQDQLYREAEYNLTRLPSNQVFTDLAIRVRDERQAAIQQGYEVPDPLELNYPAPPGVLSELELRRVKRARTNSDSEE